MTSLRLRDLRLYRGDTARAIGQLEEAGACSSGYRLWVEWSDEPGAGIQVEGGVVDFTLNPDHPNIAGLRDAPRVAVEGRWNGRSLVQASCKVVSDSEVVPTVEGPHLPSPLSYPEDQSASFFDGMSQAAGSLALATGGSQEAMFIQVLYVTGEFLEWYSGFSDARVDVAVSVYPV